MVKTGRTLREEEFGQQALPSSAFLHDEEGDDVLEHINKVKTLAEQLDAVGAPVSEDDLVITLLGSLSESYQLLITALESRADSLSWELSRSSVHDERQQAQRPTGEEDRGVPQLR
ncbi:unnamed protein product [Phytophthora fragariaefolia]|uniref:Unnamed protein product n=1 Tax=Phytophthora fragariaefolia TaxID=1490495 RepID=A0A9W6YGL9_9STRA|nr:unnamed protein product [Phytophthora fragariaefolia]